MHATLTPRRLRGLDTLRAIAIVSVMMFHLTVFGELPSSFLTVSYFGWMGVDLFFVLSGFLIGQQLLKERLATGTSSITVFYIRRAYRILPAYLSVLALYFLLPAWREYPHLPSIWKFLTFTMNFGFNMQDRGFSHAWSLCVEEHFYLLLPLLIVLLSRRSSVVKTSALIAFVMIGGIALRAFLAARFPTQMFVNIYYPTYTRLDGLVVGVTLAVIRAYRRAWWSVLMRRGHLLTSAGILCVAIVVWMFRAHDLGSNAVSGKSAIIFGFPLLSIGLGLIVASSISDNGILARFRVPGASTLAALAFSLYLTHKSVAHMVKEAFPSITSQQGPASWLLYGCACLVAAALLHVFVERVFLRLRDQTLLSKTGSVPAQAPLQVDPAI